MIPVLGTGGPGFNSRLAPAFFIFFVVYYFANVELFIDHPYSFYSRERPSFFDDEHYREGSRESISLKF